jgi:16S rRNA (uracil1498-N3)-methyltransferase
MSRTHRFYVGRDFELKHDFWLHDERLINQWNRVLRYQAGQNVLLFDGIETDRLYKIVEIKPDEAHLELVTDYERRVPHKDVYLLWSLLKKDTNDWVLQKATELGVSHFVPILSERCEKTGFDPERAEKIVIEAAEQCGRSDIPTIRESMLLKTAIEHLGEKVPLMICEQGGEIPAAAGQSPCGILIGPEGGWSDGEMRLFEQLNIPHLGLGNFTLRAETAAVTAAGILLK